MRICWGRAGGEEGANVNGFHAGGADGCQADVGVFVGAAVCRGDAEAAGGFEVDVGSGFLAGDVFGGDDGLEEVGNAHVAEGLGDDVAGASGGDGHAEFAVVVAGDFGDLFDGADFRDHFLEGGVFLPGNGLEVKLHPLFSAEYFQDVNGWDAAQGVKAVLGKVESVAVGDFLPDAPVEGHGIGQRAVAVEDKSLEGHGLNAEWRVQSAESRKQKVES